MIKWLKKQMVILTFINPIKLRLIDESKKFYKLWSVWLFIIIAIAPDFYNAISYMGWLEETPRGFVWTIRILAAVGFLSRLVKQERKPKRRRKWHSSDNTSI